ncbi:Hypothetical protein A7982_02222 [Minicystis rosea]|nr:Hypothetical protein A7982_02222 [Minicystis rosea]
MSRLETRQTQSPDASSSAAPPPNGANVGTTSGPDEPEDD